MGDYKPNAPAKVFRILFVLNLCIIALPLIYGVVGGVFSWISHEDTGMLLLILHAGAIYLITPLCVPFCC